MAGIDFMFDDSPIYLESFHDIDTTYLHVINQGRKIFEVRQKFTTTDAQRLC
jgi:hypothetical protein